MSRELDYFPPNTSKWWWTHKSLDHAPWVCNLVEQMMPKSIGPAWPAAVRLSVDLIEGEYVWRVDVTDWRHSKHVEVGTALTAKEAVAAAESVGEAAFRALAPDWVLLALEAGWRPPLARSAP